MHAILDRLKQSALWQRVFRTRADDCLPHKVSHQRIYIVPSKRGAAFLLTLLLMLIASINYSLSLGYALSFVLTGLFAATLLHTYRNLAGLNVLSIKSENTFAPEDASFSISVHNNQARIRHGINLSVPTGAYTRIRVDANANAEATLSIKTQTRGVCKLGRLTLQSDWPLGLWTSWSYLHVPEQCLVFPHPEPDAPPLPVESGSQGTARSVVSLQGDVAGLRDYQPGDSIGTIAWKSAARGLGLQSRTFDSEGALAHTVLSLHRTGMSDLEAQLSRLCAWVLDAEAMGQDYSLNLSGYTLDKGRGAEHRTRALSALAIHSTDLDRQRTQQANPSEKQVSGDISESQQTGNGALTSSGSGSGSGSGAILR